jgi:hypothetical protein
MKSTVTIILALLGLGLVPPAAHSASIKSVGLNPGEGTFLLLNASIGDRVALRLTYISQDGGSANLTLIDPVGRVRIQTGISTPTQAFSIVADSSGSYVAKLFALMNNPAKIQLLATIDMTPALLPGVPSEGWEFFAIELALLAALLAVGGKAWRSGV